MQRASVLSACIPQSSVYPGVYIYGSGVLSIDSTAKIHCGASLELPIRIGARTTVMPGALVRQSWIGTDCIVGHCVEIARSVLLDGARVPHRSTVLDSVLGEKCNLSGGAGTANALLKVLPIGAPLVDVAVRLGDGHELGTGLTKLGLVLGSRGITSANLATAPATLVGKDAVILPTGGEVLSGVWCRPGKIQI
jgi:UDP-N-acetylglucosamine diphosphorylase / glucose-1-phosphate thymidylyltransferase / UDP-N-acetylgalactosamine diphosphorylase / glucosamine-1-phosphate N-acetyltransferase / galactosamine-1-phosphate N-acetyltransferase